MQIKPDLYRAVWAEASAVRDSNELLNQAVKIQCPVVAIHGDYDSHPAKGVEEPLNKMLNNFKMIFLTNCGHTPWKEKLASDRFYSVLKDEIGTDRSLNP
jgi:pimeloyl-ACP methyl ester carboxylesterase